MSVWLVVAFFGAKGLLGEIPDRQPRYVSVFAQGTFSTESELPTPRDLDDLRALWHWTAMAFPRRFEPVDLPFEPLTPNPDRLTVRVVGLDEDETVDDLEVIAAPVAMWDEVPESLLPHWPVPLGGRLLVPWDPDTAWRVRLLGDGRGSWWQDVRAGTSSVTLRLLVAASVTVEVVDPDGERVARPSALVRERPAGGRSAQRTTTRLGDGSDGIVLRALPPTMPIELLVQAPDHLMRGIRAPVVDLPSQVTLDRGASLVGRLVDAESMPVLGAEVQAEAWPGRDVPALVQSRDTTDDDGRFELGPMPIGLVHVAGAAPGFVPLDRTLELQATGINLGDVTLEAALDVRLAVVDEFGEAVSGAEVRGYGIRPRVTDAEGQTTIPGVPPERPTEIEVQAEHFLPLTKTIAPPYDEVSVLTLRSAYRVSGRFVDAEGVPVADASLTLRRGRRTERPPIEDDGTFVLDLTPAHAHALTLASPRTRPLTIELPPGEGGSERDLGDLVASMGLTVAGRLVHAADGTPVAGGAVSTRRDAVTQPLAAWAFGERLMARSDAEGRFRLSGLAEGPAVLRIEGSRFARREMRIELTEEEPEQTLGDIELVSGSEVLLEVVASDDDLLDGTSARLDLGGRWQEMDMLVAPITDRLARFRHVPAGEAMATVLVSGALLCQVRIDVPGDEDLVEARCEAEDMTVTGTVSVAGTPAGPGILSWGVPGSEAPPGLIMNQRSAGGLLRQHVLGVGRPQVDVAVAADGYFRTEGLRSGRWEVAWVPADGSRSKVQLVDLPVRDVVEVPLDFPGQSVVGRVEDGDGQPIAGARVRETRSGAVVFSDDDGRFRFTGLETGAHFLKARQGELESPAARIVLDADLPAPPVVLILGPPREEGLTFEVHDGQGTPMPGVLVFVDLAGAGQRIITTAASGVATLRLDPPFPNRVRAAAHASGRWALGPWIAWQEARDTSPSMVMGPGARLSIMSEKTVGVVRIVEDSGWDVTMLLSRLGFRPNLHGGTPLVVTGLPPGSYDLQLGPVSRRVVVKESESIEVEFD